MIQISHQFAKTLQITMRLCLNFIELTKTFDTFFKIFSLNQMNLHVMCGL